MSQADLLPVEYVTTWCSRCRRPSPTSPTNKAADLPGCCSMSQPRCCRPRAADPRHLGARIGATLVPHLQNSSADAPPARARHRAWRRAVRGRRALGGVARPGSFLRCGCCRATVPGGASCEELRWLHEAERSCGSSATRRTGQCRCLRALAGTDARRCGVGGLCQAGRSRDPRPCWRTCRATRIVWRSPTSRLLARLDERGVTFRWKELPTSERQDRTHPLLSRPALAPERDRAHTAPPRCTCATERLPPQSGTAGCWPTRQPAPHDRLAAVRQLFCAPASALRGPSGDDTVANTEHVTAPPAAVHRQTAAGTMLLIDAAARDPIPPSVHRTRGRRC